jgi:hypothetical protein
MTPRQWIATYLEPALFGLVILCAVLAAFRVVERADERRNP